MSKLLSVLIAGIFAAVTFTAVAADEAMAPAKPAASTEAAKPAAKKEKKSHKEKKKEKKETGPLPVSSQIWKVIAFLCRLSLYLR